MGSRKPPGYRSTRSGKNRGEPRHHELPARAQSGMDRPFAWRRAGAMGQLRRASGKRHAGAHVGGHRPLRREDRGANRGARHHQVHGNVVREFSVCVRPARRSQHRLKSQSNSKSPSEPSEQRASSNPLNSFKLERVCRNGPVKEFPPVFHFRMKRRDNLNTRSL